MDSPSPAPLPPTTLAPTLTASGPVAVPWALHPGKEGVRSSPSPGLGPTSVGAESRFSALDMQGAVWEETLSPSGSLSRLCQGEFRILGVEIWLKPNLGPSHPGALRAPGRFRSLRVI